MRRLAIALTGLALFLVPIWLTWAAGADPSMCGENSAAGDLAQSILCDYSADTLIHTMVPPANRASIRGSSPSPGADSGHQ